MCTSFNKAAHYITNCAYMGMDSSSTYVCKSCKTGYVLNNAGTNCIEYDGDSKCIKAGNNDTGCSECWWPYWFHDALCKQSLIRVLI